MHVQAVFLCHLLNRRVVFNITNHIGCHTWLVGVINATLERDVVQNYKITCDSVLFLASLSLADMGFFRFVVIFTILDKIISYSSSKLSWDIRKYK